MNPESQLWASVKNALPKTAHVERIENSLERGTPDLHICHKGKDFYVELKVQPTSRILIRKEQNVWAVRRNMSDGKSYVLSLFGGLYILHQSPFLVVKHNETYQEIISEPILQMQNLKALLELMLCQ